jgi:hypothetical protein
MARSAAVCMWKMAETWRAHLRGRGVLLLLKQPGGVLRGYLFTASLPAYGRTLLLRPEQARYLQVQLFWVGQVSDLAKRLTSARGGDDERSVTEQPTQNCALKRQTRHLIQGVAATVRRSSPPMSTIRPSVTVR